MGKVFLTIVILNIFYLSYSQDKCSDILKEGVFDLKISNIDKSKREYLFSILASENYESENTKKGKALKAIYEYSTQGSYDEQSFRELKKELFYKNVQLRSITEEQNTYLYSRVANSEIINKWLECMNGGGNNLGFNCQISEKDSINFELQIRVNGNANYINQITCEDANFSYDKKNIPNKIEYGSNYILTFRRIDPYQASNIILRGVNGLNSSISYSVYIPAKLHTPDLTNIKIRELMIFDEISYWVDNHAGGRCHERLASKLLTITNSVANIRSFSYTFQLNREIFSCCPGCPFIHKFTGPYTITINGTFALQDNKVTINFDPIVFRSDDPSFDSGSIGVLVDFIHSKNKMPI